MKPIKYKISRRTLLAISGLLAASLATAGNIEAGNAGTRETGTSEIQVGRYQSVMLQPTDEQIDLLSHIVEIDLPESIRTIGQAITHLLDGSGFRLLSPKLAESCRSHLFAMPLPDVQRQLGPLSLLQALKLLGGPAFCLVIDPTYRLVSFELIKRTNDAHARFCQ